jgi:hypothetical protein
MTLFIIYFILFVIPFSWSLLLTKDDEKDKFLFLTKLCLFPSVLLLIIEIIQISKIGLAYFWGWNITDLFFIILFSIYAWSKIELAKDDKKSKDKK